MVVARSESFEVVETVNSHSVFGSVITDGSGIPSNLTLGDVVRSLSAKQEAIATEDSVSGEGGALTFP